MFSFDMTNQSASRVYFDGVLQTFTTFTQGAGPLNFTYSNHGIGAYPVGFSNKLGGDLSDFWYDPGTYIDLSIAANRAKFFEGGKPVYLGDNGSLPTGAAPEIYLTGNTTAWHTNKGTGGGFTENGELGESSSNPSGPLCLETWTARESNRDWYEITSSSDGMNLAAVVYAGQICTSTDGGVSWTARASSRGWRDIASSSDGTKIVAVVENGQIWTSTDNGGSWTARESVRFWHSVASSEDGMKLAAGVY